jgi:AraC family transcriptional regulator, positive regulator of tynA and feaB
MDPALAAQDRLARGASEQAGALAGAAAAALPLAVSTDLVRPSDRQAFWTEAICRSFANVDTQPLRRGAISGHFEVVDIGAAKVARFDTSPQNYTRSARLVSAAGSDEFMFDFQIVGQSLLSQGTRESFIRPGCGVLYDARRPFEDRLDGPDHHAEVLIVTVPSQVLLRAVPGAEALCAVPIAAASVITRSIMKLLRSALSHPRSERGPLETHTIVAYLAAVLLQATGRKLALARTELFPLVDIHLRNNLMRTPGPVVLAAEFGISERTFHRIFADCDTSFERYMLRLRVERFRQMLSTRTLADVPIATLALDCGFADGAHATRTFKTFYRLTPREFRTSGGDTCA